MKVIQIDTRTDYSAAITEAKEVLAAGGIIICPTDTLYSIAANALDVQAVKRIFEIKRRPFSKPLPVIARNMLWVKELAYISFKNQSFLNKVWPGKVTVVLPKKDIIPDIVTGGQKTVGIRIPDHPLIDRILGKFGYPLALSSTNQSSDEPILKIDELIEKFRGMALKPDLILDIGTLPESDPSTVIDLTTGSPKILRVGPSKPEQLLKLLKEDRIN